MTDSELRCAGFKDTGEPCGSNPHLIRPNGYCPAHDPDEPNRMREIARLGGEATKAKLAGMAFDEADIARIVSIDDAKTALDTIRVAILTRKITHAEGNAASKAVAEWVKADAASLTKGLVNELKLELESKTREIEALRHQLAGHARTTRLAKVAS